MKFRESDHNNPQDSQVFIALTGTAEAIKKELELILEDIENHGKPMQGIYLKNNLNREVITPLWNKTQY